MATPSLYPVKNPKTGPTGPFKQTDPYAASSLAGKNCWGFYTAPYAAMELLAADPTAKITANVVAAQADALLDQIAVLDDRLALKSLAASQRVTVQQHHDFLTAVARLLASPRTPANKIISDSTRSRLLVSTAVNA